MDFAVIDIETTGGNFTNDKITEVAIVKFNGEKVVDTFQTLINPHRSIPHYITQLTGISDDMVSDAPSFFEVAKQIVEFTEDCFFVAHNARFDYGFIQAEFKNLGYSYQKKTLCTVKLSRKLLPGHKSYSLGKLCNDLGIKLVNHHRAMADAEATVEVMKRLVAVPTFTEIIQTPKQKLMSQTNISEELLNKINDFPEKIGIYYFYNKQGEIIYIGKSINVKKRIFSHLYNENSQKAIRMKEEVIDFDFELTNNELIALLLENEEVKKHQPKYNRALKKTSFPFGLIAFENQDGFKKIELVKTGKNTFPIMAFANKHQALERLEDLETTFGLCQKVNKNDSRIGTCFNRAIKVCNGACEGLETPETYNLRVDEALKELGFKNKNFYLALQTSEDDYAIFIKDGQYAGFEKVTTEHISTQFEDATPRIDRDAFFIINSYLKLYKSKIVIC